MSKSRGRRQHKTRRKGPPRPRQRPITDAQLAMLPAMLEADAAELRGDAAGALATMAGHPYDADGRPFWRPWRVVRLNQLAALGDVLPAWVTSRWIAAQALQMTAPVSRGISSRAMRVAVDVRGGPQALVGANELDARCKVMDHDWVYRQVYLYEADGLAVFLRDVASPDLVVGADRIDEWIRAPMRALRLASDAGGGYRWADVLTDQAVDVLDLGATSLVDVGDCVLGRLVPAGAAQMFEGPPLWVPESVAVEVGHDPTAWLAAVRRAMRADATCRDREPLITNTLYGTYLVTDLPDLAWCLAPADGLRLLRNALAGVEPDDQIFDPWHCVAAALLDPSLLGLFMATLGEADAPALLRLADRLSGPAADLCRLLTAREDEPQTG